jgi:hypothetical protein
MSELHWESWAALLAFAISLVYIWAPVPYAMGAFTFIAQPLFLVAFLGYAVKVFRELRQRKVL